MTTVRQTRPEWLVDQLDARLARADVHTEPLNRIAACAAAAHLLDSLGIITDLDAWPPLLEDVPESTTAIRERADLQGREPATHSPTRLIGYAHQILDNAGAAPQWPARTGRSDEAGRASVRLQLALGVLPHLELEDVLDRTWSDREM